MIQKLAGLTLIETVLIMTILAVIGVMTVPKYVAAGGKAVAGGIQVSVDGSSFTIPTYTNSLCNEPTHNVNDQVGCVGAI